MKKLLFILSMCLVLTGCSTLNALLFGEIEPIPQPPQPKIIDDYDEFRNITFYKNTRFHDADNLQLYIAKESDNKFLRCKCHYKNKDWIFFDTIYLVNEKGDRITYKPVFSSKHTEVLYGTGLVYESMDFILTDKDIPELEKLIQGDDVKMRLQGSNYYYECSFTNQKAAQEIINFYKEL